ncbi:TlpA family protein disulfide reductase [Chryseobacterium ureilyticum]|nr:TlpA disulfide reductase family protein [Chryseobacterium ureilyticum]
MKKLLYISMLYLLMAQHSIAQKRTLLNVRLENFKDSVNSLELIVSNGFFAVNTAKNYVLKATDGNFHFDFPLNETSQAYLYLNDRSDLLVPGSFGVLINPGDSLNFTLRDDKLGLVNMEISGRGSEKILIVKKTAKKMFSSYVYKKSYRKKTMEEKFIELDNSLNIIDSTFDRESNKYARDFRLAKAQLVDQTLDGLLQYCMWNFDDSVRYLFNKFVRNKKRIAPLLDSATLDYFGGFHILPYYISLSNRDEIGDRYDMFHYNYPLQYASLISKEFGSIEYVKDFLLSDLTINIFRQNWYGQVSKDMYRYYLENANKRNRHFIDVFTEFEKLKDVLKPGKAFYNFNLIDTNGVYHSLQQMKGKVVILDFWFTGCGACKQLVSELVKIEDQLKDERIQFVSINVDKTVSTWKRGIGIYSVPSSLQLSTEGRRNDHPVLKFGNVNAFPTLIVLDKQGKIVGIPPHPMKDIGAFRNYIEKCL